MQWLIRLQGGTDIRAGPRGIGAGDHDAIGEIVIGRRRVDRSQLQVKVEIAGSPIVPVYGNIVRDPVGRVEIDRAVSFRRGEKIWARLTRLFGCGWLMFLVLTFVVEEREG